MGEILDAALKYAEAGFAVIPVTRWDKNPYNSNGSRGGSVDPDKIRQWWSWWPDANVAIVCGRLSGNLLAIDVDVKDGKHGDFSLEQWQAAHGDFPSTVRQITGSGGNHYFFRCETVAQYKNTIDALPGVDVRGEYAYVVVAPSVYQDGRIYTWDRDISILDTDEIAEANDSVMDLLKLNPQEEKKKADPNRKKLKVRDIQKGQRNDSIFRYASLQRGADVPYDIALDSAVALNNSWNNPLPESEVRKSVDSAYKYAPNEATIYGSAPEPEPDSDDLELKTLNQFEEQDIEWLVRGYIPKEQITLVCGTGGTGKTSFWTALAAALSSGTNTIFDGDDELFAKREKQTIMFFSAEDDVEHVIKKKLDAQHADMNRILTISVSDQRMDKVVFGSKYLEKLIDKYRPDVCIFDPIQAFIGEKTKLSERNAVRQKMRSLIEWGKRYGTTFIVVMHTNKLLNTWGRNRMADSADLWDIARSVLMIGNTESQDIKYISQEKSNYGPTMSTVLFTNLNGIATWYMWSGLKDKDFVMAETKARNAQKGTNEIEEVQRFIMSLLSEYQDGLYTKELDAQMEDSGFKKWAIKQAKANLKKEKKIVYVRSNMTDPWIIKKQ